MKKIRIGNDIRLRLRIDGLTNLTQANIKEVRCYLINSSFGKDEEAAKNKHARRFTREVFPEFYIPSAYNMHGCGAPCYNVHPANVCHYDHFLPDFHRYHWWPGFHGFGIYPDKFERYHRFWHGLPPVGHFEHPFIGGPGRKPQPWCLVESEVLNEANTISCLFPAKAQELLGTYKLVVVLTLFERGWGKHNLRTYTVDKGDVFELVDDYTGESGNITISVDDSGDKEQLVDSLEVNNGPFTLICGDSLQIGEHDITHKQYNVIAILKDGTAQLFNPYDWRFDDLKFQSADESILAVDMYGTLMAYDLPDDVGEQEVAVRVYNADNTDVYFDFNVIVKSSNGVLRMGFSNAETAQELNEEELQHYAYGSQNDYTIHNDANGKYLWIVSSCEINNVESSGFYVPLEEPVIKHNFYMYRSSAAILQGDMKIVIKYKHYEQ